MWAASHVAKLAKLENGWRLVINDGDEGCNLIILIKKRLISLSFTSSYSRRNQTLLVF